MPLPPPPLAAPYPEVETILEYARVRLNDAIQSIGGDVLTDTAPFSQTYFNAAWHRLQEQLADLGSQRTNGHVYLYSIPPAGTIDPGSQVCLTWTYYFDGAGNFYVPPTVPVLPSDFMEPLKVKQRVSGTVTSFREIECSPAGIPSETKIQCQRHWLWREDGLWMTGATQPVDLELDYICYLPDIVDNFPLVATPWYGQVVPIMRSENALSWYLAAEVAMARGDVDAAALDQKGDMATKQIVNRQYRARQRVNQRRRSYRHSESSSSYY